MSPLAEVFFQFFGVFCHILCQFFSKRIINELLTCLFRLQGIDHRSIKSMLISQNNLKLYCFYKGSFIWDLTILCEKLYTVEW